MNKLIAVILIGVLTIVVSLSACSEKVSKVTVTIGQNPGETKSLIYIAEERGLFTDNGIEVVYKNYDSGAASASASLKGEVDMAACAEYVVIGSVLKKENTGIIAVIDKFENVYIVARFDKGIQDITDIKGKRIGVARQTSAEFYLGRFLDLHGMSIHDIIPVNIPPAQSLDALESGNVDAVAVFEPNAYEIRRKLGDTVIVWPAQSGQLNYFNIISTDSWIADHQETISRLLEALVKAEDYIVSYPDEAKEIIRKRLQNSEDYINKIWPEHQFSVSLDRGLIAAMEDEARWMISNNLTMEKQVPDFMDYIYEDALKALKPEAVNIIR